MKVGKENCVMSLFTGNVRDIKHYCKIVILKEGMQSLMERLTVTKVLLINIEHFKIKCPHKTETRHEGCRHCIIKIGCGCRVANEKFFVTPQFAKCANTTENMTRVYPFNLRILSEFFGRSELRDLRANTLLEEQLEIVLPQFRFEEGKGKDHVQNEEKIKVDIDKLMEKIKGEGKIYETHAMVLAERMEDMDARAVDTWDWKDLTLLITTIMTGLCMILIMILFARVIKLSAVMIISPTVRAIEEGVTRRVLIYKKEEPEPEIEEIVITEEFGKRNETETAWIMDIKLSDHASTIQLTLIIIITLILIYICIKIFKKIQNNYTQFSSAIWINLSHGKRVIPIRIQVLGDAIENFIFEGLEGVKSVELRWGIAPTLNIEWGISARHKTTDRKIEIREEVKLSWRQYIQIKAIILKPNLMAIAYTQVGAHVFEDLRVRRPRSKKESKGAEFPKVATEIERKTERASSRIYPNLAFTDENGD